MEDMSDYRPALDPALVRKVHKERRAQKASQATNELDRMRSELSAQRRENAERDALHLLRLKAETRFSNLMRELQRSPVDASTIKARRIIQLIAEKHGLPTASITGQSRQKHIVKARHEAIAEVRRIRPDLTITQIGKIFGDRDHTTILAALRKIDARKEAA